MHYGQIAKHYMKFPYIWNHLDTFGLYCLITMISVIQWLLHLEVARCCKQIRSDSDGFFGNQGCDFSTDLSKDSRQSLLARGSWTNSNATRGSPWRICVGLDDSHGIGSPLSHPSPSRWNAFAPAPHEMILTLRVVPSLLLPEDVRTQLQLKVFDMDDRWIIHSNDTQRTTFKAILMPMNMLSSLQITSMPSISNCKRKQIAGLSWSPLWQTSSNRALSSENAWTYEDSYHPDHEFHEFHDYAHNIALHSEYRTGRPCHDMIRCYLFMIPENHWIPTNVQN